MLSTSSDNSVVISCTYHAKRTLLCLRSKLEDSEHCEHCQGVILLKCFDFRILDSSDSSRLSRTLQVRIQLVAKIFNWPSVKM